MSKLDALDAILEHAEILRKEAAEFYEIFVFNEQHGITHHKLYCDQATYHAILAVYEQNKAIIELLKRNPSSQIDYEAIEKKLLKS